MNEILHACGDMFLTTFGSGALVGALVAILAMILLDFLKMKRKKES